MVFWSRLFFSIKYKFLNLTYKHFNYKKACLQTQTHFSAHTAMKQAMMQLQAITNHHHQKLLDRELMQLYAYIVGITQIMLKDILMGIINLIQMLNIRKNDCFWALFIIILYFLIKYIFGVFYVVFMRINDW